MITIDLDKQPTLDDVPKAIIQISFTKTLVQSRNKTTFFIIAEAIETILEL